MSKDFDWSLIEATILLGSGPIKELSDAESI